MRRTTKGVWDAQELLSHSGNGEPSRVVCAFSSYIPGWLCRMVLDRHACEAATGVLSLIHLEDELVFVLVATCLAVARSFFQSRSMGDYCSKSDCLSHQFCSTLRGSAQLMGIHLLDS